MSVVFESRGRPFSRQIAGFVCLAGGLLAGIWIDSWPLILAAVALVGVDSLLVRPRVRIVDQPSGERRIELRSFVRRRSVSLSYLREAKVVRRAFGLRDTVIRLCDARGGAVDIPLLTWRHEDELVDLIRASVRSAGLAAILETGRVRAKTEQSLNLLLAVGIVANLAVAGATVASGHRETNPLHVTKRALQERAGESADPFVGVIPEDVVLVPLDREAEEEVLLAAPRVRARLRLGVSTTRSFRIDASALDERRHQLDAFALVKQLAQPFQLHYGLKPSLLVGITSHDTFTPDVPRWRFVFNELSYVRQQSYAVISTARLSGVRKNERLLKFLIRDVGLLYYGLPHSGSRSSVLWAPILSRRDVDLLGFSLGDPPYTREQLTAARRKRLQPGWHLPRP
jgi:hypothetical protein